MTADTGVYEFIFGALASEQDELLRFWEVLGFAPTHEGGMAADRADRVYGHRAQLQSIRLAHKGCKTFGTGLVRLQFWSQLRNEGLGNSRPLEIGSRWMGMYTHDVLQVVDSLTNSAVKTSWQLWTSPLVSAPLTNPPPAVDFYQPFVGLREQLVFGPRFRLAFIQRGGFDRPGFGTFDESLAYKNTEGSHANIVQPTNAFDTGFYKHVLGLETAPYGDAHDSGHEAPTKAALALEPDQTFRVERLRAKNCPSGLLQVYSPYWRVNDARDNARPGSGNLCCYSYRVADVDGTVSQISSYGGSVYHQTLEDEFGNPSVAFDGPDGIAWIATAVDHAR